MRIVLATALVVLAGCSSGSAEEQRRPLDKLHQDSSCTDDVTPYQPSDGVVSSEALAREVAFKYLTSAYPTDRNLRRPSDLRMTLANGVWSAYGTIPKDVLGGVAAINFCQSNGRVLFVFHGK